MPHKHEEISATGLHVHTWGGHAQPQAKNLKRKTFSRTLWGTVGRVNNPIALAVFV